MVKKIKKGRKKRAMSQMRGARFFINFKVQKLDYESVPLNTKIIVFDTQKRAQFFRISPYMQSC